MKQDRRKRNFTLTELLVVIAIMGILMGITLPALKGLTGGNAVQASAQRIQAVLMNARAMAAKYNAVYTVTFNNTKNTETNNSGNESTEPNDWWCAIIEPDLHTTTPATFPFADYDALENQQIGPRYKLEQGSKFLAFSYKDSGGKLWNSGDYADTVSCAIIATDGARIGFTPMGRALFGDELTGAKVESTTRSNTYQYIGLCKEYDKNVRLGLKIHRYTGEVSIVAASDN